MSGALKILPHYTYNDYVHWEGKWEIIDGIPYAMSPAPVPKHQIVAVNLSAEFRFALKVCKPIEKKFLDFPPSLVVEVVSPSSVLIDRHKKFYAYQEQGIPYYLIISPDTEEIEIYVLEEGEYNLKQKGRDFSFSFRFDDDCEATIDFSEIWK